MSANEMFSEMNAAAKAAFYESRQRTFEEGCVLKLLRRSGITTHKLALRSDAKHHHGQGVLNFRWFKETYPRFPITLFSEKLKDTSGEKIGWTQLFGANFIKLPWVRQFQRLLSEENFDLAKGHAGLVFNAPHADQAATAVVHTFPFADDAAPATRIVRRHSGILYTIEAFSSFVETVGNSWT